MAGERHGMGSSRDWAAKAQHLLGVRAVFAASFERIHRTNLVGMGILPLVLPSDARRALGEIRASDRFTVDLDAEALAPGAVVRVRHERADGGGTDPTSSRHSRPPSRWSCSGREV